MGDIATLRFESERELYNRAKELDLRGRSGMTKPQLAEAIRSRS